MKNVKFSMIGFILLLVTSILSGLSGATSHSFEVTSVEIDDHEIIIPSASFPTIHVERGQNLPVKVFFRGVRNTEDVRLRAYIGGYEFGTIEDESDIFEVFNGVSDSERVVLKIPKDIDASDNYTLNVELFDDDTSQRYQFKLRVEESRHAVSVFDVILNPPTNVRAGQPLFASVRVENLGARTEESIKVTVSIPALGVAASEYVDMLITEEDVRDLRDQKIVFGTRRTSTSTNDLVLLIPEDAREGEYEVKTVVEYNRGHTKEESTQKIMVKGARQSPAAPSVETVVNIDATAQSAEVGKGAVFKVSVANLGAEAKTFMVELAGTAGLTTRVDPQTQTVAAEKTADFNVFVSPNEGAQPSARTFTVTVKDSQGSVVSEKALTLNVAAAEDSDTLKNVLEVAFIVLLIILVIVGLVVLVKKLGGEEPEEPVEGKTYY